MSHRALILGARAKGETVIAGLLESDDVLRTAFALRQFEVRVEQFGPGRWRVFGGDWRSPDAPIDCGNSGTSARLLMGAAAGCDLAATFTGDDSLRRRPMRRVTEPLAAMGATFDQMDRLPLTLRGGNLGSIHHVNIPPSAQVKTAILLAGLRAAGEVEVAEPVTSRDHTEIMLRAFGADVEQAGRVVRLGSKRTLAATLVPVPADPSSAAFAWLAAAIIPGSEVRTDGVLVNPLRIGFLDCLAEMGAAVATSGRRVETGELVADVTVKRGPLQPVHVPAARIPSMIDEIPALAIACAFASGESVIEGLSELRHKESDRLAGILAGLTVCGVEAASDGDTLRIAGRGEVRGGATVRTNRDHRIAMAFATLGLAAREPVVVDGAEMIATSFPGFVRVMRSIGADIDELE